MLFISSSPAIWVLSHAWPPSWEAELCHTYTPHFDASQAECLGRNLRWSKGSVLLWDLRTQREPQGGPPLGTSTSRDSWSLILGRLIGGGTMACPGGTGLPSSAATSPGDVTAAEEQEGLPLSPVSPTLTALC